MEIKSASRLSKCSRSDCTTVAKQQELFWFKGGTRVAYDDGGTPYCNTHIPPMPCNKCDELITWYGLNLVDSNGDIVAWNVATNQYCDKCVDSPFRCFECKCPLWDGDQTEVDDKIYCESCAPEQECDHSYVCDNCGGGWGCGHDFKCSDCGEEIHDGVFIKLFEGQSQPFKRLDEDLVVGPMLGPFSSVEVTGMLTLRIGELQFHNVNGLIYYDGKYYANFRILSASDVDIDEIQKYNLEKATPPAIRRLQ